MLCTSGGRLKKSFMVAVRSESFTAGDSSSL
jgi:hypothetical protein